MPANEYIENVNGKTIKNISITDFASDRNYSLVRIEFTCGLVKKFRSFSLDNGSFIEEVF